MNQKVASVRQYCSDLVRYSRRKTIEVKIGDVPVGGDNPIRVQSMTTVDTTVYRTYMCLICGFVYSEAAGLPEEGIPPGTRWEDVPMNWSCPECGARKEDFEMMEI